MCVRSVTRSPHSPSRDYVVPDRGPRSGTAERRRRHVRQRMSAVERSSPATAPVTAAPSASPRRTVSTTISVHRTQKTMSITACLPMPTDQTLPELVEEALTVPGRLHPFPGPMVNNDVVLQADGADLVAAHPRPDLLAAVSVLDRTLTVHG